MFRYMSQLRPSIKHVSLFSDSCSGQNHNQYVAALHLYATQVLPINTIDYKCLVSGHTQMECDSMHSVVEYAYKNVFIYSTSDWRNVLFSAKRNKKEMETKLERAHIRLNSYNLQISITVRSSQTFTSQINTLTLVGSKVNWLKIRQIDG